MTNRITLPFSHVIHRMTILCVVTIAFATIGCGPSPPPNTLNEYRIIAKHLASGLHNSLEAARQHDKRPTHDYVKEMDRLIFDFGKIKTDDSDIRRVVSLALPAAEEVVLRLNNIHSIPHISDSQALQAFIEDTITMNPLGRGYRMADARKKAIENEQQKLQRAALELHRARYLLPDVAKNFASAMPNSSSLEVGFHEMVDGSYNIFHITNNDGNLQDCTFEVKITAKKGDSTTDIYFVEQFAKGKTFWALCYQPIYNIASVDVNVLSPGLNTTINYVYDHIERGKTHQWLFGGVKFVKPRYTPRSRGIFSDWQASFETYIEGYPRLPACSFTVTFVADDQRQAFVRDYEGWTSGYSGTIYSNAAPLTFKPKEIIAEISFLDSAFVIRETFVVSDNGSLQRQPQ